MITERLVGHEEAGIDGRRLVLAPLPAPREGRRRASQDPAGGKLSTSIRLRRLISERRLPERGVRGKRQTTRRKSVVDTQLI